MSRVYDDPYMESVRLLKTGGARSQGLRVKLIELYTEMIVAHVVHGTEFNWRNLHALITRLWCADARKKIRQAAWNAAKGAGKQ